MASKPIVDASKKSRILTLAILICGALFLGCLAVQSFIFERLDPNGVPGKKENAIRWSEYYEAARIYKIGAIISLALLIWFAFASLRGRRRMKLVRTNMSVD